MEGIEVSSNRRSAFLRVEGMSSRVDVNSSLTILSSSKPTNRVD